jgi:nucleotide-binding universal stress UspA family protein
MSLKDIIVPIDTTDACKPRVEAAISIALAHDAHVTGVAVLYRPYIPPHAEVEMSADLLEARQRILRESAEEAGANFQAQLESAGCKGEWRIVEGDPIEVLCSQARYGDLLVVSQNPSAGDFLPGGHEMPDRVILSAGRPVLVVPYIYKGEPIGKRVMVAWDAGRMAARAVHDALPIMEKAENVTIMVANPKAGDDGHGDVPGADLATHLSRHGVKAVANHTVSKDMDIGDLLLTRVADDQADMLVLGAYGHARWRELVLGGVTAHILEHMTVPVLMSH